MKSRRRKYSFSFLVFIFSLISSSVVSQHPNLSLTIEGVESIRGNLEEAPLFEQAVDKARAEVDAEIDAGIFVPVPKDMAGGYTHERHKRNFFILQKAGNLFQITRDEKYAKYTRDVFLAYAELFPSLGLHPTNRSYATGKIFWQCLNDANWLVYCSQAYDCIHDWLPEADRRNLESNLFRPLADFLSVGNPQFFNRIHNHSTWANAAVGMIGLVMQDDELINRALYGLKNQNIDPSSIDNDGGYIKKDNQLEAGFFAQLDHSFSPDGYFTEGPYYLRYAMTPFILFANALNNHDPGMKIFEYREGILKKSVISLLYQTDWNGNFFPVNDAQKGMSWLSRELVFGVDIAYAKFGQDPSLLSIVEKQDRVTLDENGFITARDLHMGKAKPLERNSIFYRDGANGEKGGVAIMRSGSAYGELCTVFKFSAHGMGHGHFDRLSYSVYDETGEVVQDYGSARWVNIDQKGGGRYLPENNTWAKQTVAHNTLVVDRRTQSEGKVKTGDAHAPMLNFYDFDSPGYQVVSARDTNAYPGTHLERTLIQLNDHAFGYPVLIDLFRVQSDREHTYDLPFWFQGHLLETNIDYEAKTGALATLGNDAGYQHLWEEARGKTEQESCQLTFFRDGRFYTSTWHVNRGDELIFGRIGANDPHFNLRRDPCFILRRNEKKSTVFISALEPHGTYSTTTEIPIRPYCQISSIQVLKESNAYTVFEIELKNGHAQRVFVAHQDQNTETLHQLDIDGNQIQWKGPVEIKNL